MDYDQVHNLLAEALDSTVFSVPYRIIKTLEVRIEPGSYKGCLLRADWKDGPNKYDFAYDIGPIDMPVQYLSQVATLACRLLLQALENPPPKLYWVPPPVDLRTALEKG